jgi:hypothetical protein
MTHEALLAKALEAKQHMQWEEHSAAAESAATRHEEEELLKWHQKTDSESGCAYYEHVDTGEIREIMWHAPTDEDEGAVEPPPIEVLDESECSVEEEGQHDSHHGWVEKHDDESGHLYYEHSETGEVSWQKPDCMADASAEGEGAVVAETGILSIADDEAHGEWEEKWDEKSGFPYYENTATGEITWDHSETEWTRETPHVNEENASSSDQATSVKFPPIHSGVECDKVIQDENLPLSPFSSGKGYFDFEAQLKSPPVGDSALGGTSMCNQQP